MAGNPSDRRKSERIGVQFRVGYRFRALDPKTKLSAEVHEGKAQNVSHGGLLLRGPLPDQSWTSKLLTGTFMLDAEFTLPGQSDALKIESRIAWIEPTDKEHVCCFGVSFAKLGKKEKDSLAKYLKDKEGAK